MDQIGTLSRYKRTPNDRFAILLKTLSIGITGEFEEFMFAAHMMQPEHFVSMLSAASYEAASHETG